MKVIINTVSNSRWLHLPMLNAAPILKLMQCAALFLKPYFYYGAQRKLALRTPDDSAGLPPERGKGYEPIASYMSFR